jgi:hypothetical protein
LGWKETLETLKAQFEARAAASRGLHHLMVEVANDERDRMRGPDWFVRESRLDSSGPWPFHRAEPWRVVQFSGLPGDHPRFREIRPGEAIDAIPEDRIIRDGSGLHRAVFEPMRLRSSYLCGDSTSLKSFQSLAESASRVLTDAPGLSEHELAADLTELFRVPRRGIRYIFGDVSNPPTHFIANGWQGGRLVYEHRVLIDVPIAEDPPGCTHWLLLLHRLSWRRNPGSPLQGQRLAWHENTTLPYEWVVEREFDPGLPGPWQERLAQIPTKSYYSVLSDRERPLDVNLASAFAVDILLSVHPGSKPAAHPKQRSSVDYTKESWYRLRLPKVVHGAARDLRKRVKPKIVLMTATK